MINTFVRCRLSLFLLRKPYFTFKATRYLKIQPGAPHVNRYLIAMASLPQCVVHDTERPRLRYANLCVVVWCRDVVDRAVIKMKETPPHDGDTESASSQQSGSGETTTATWMSANDQRHRSERSPDTSMQLIDQHGTTVGPLADAHRYQWSTLNAGYSSAHRRHVRCSVLPVYPFWLRVCHEWQPHSQP